MSTPAIIKAVGRAYQTMIDRGWDTIYWAIDLHGVCLKSNYKANTYEWINTSARSALRLISSKAENNIILWSSCHEAEKAAIVAFFMAEGIAVHGFNANPEVANTETGNFTEKFYFSVLLDDKAGFDPNEDWAHIINYYVGKPCGATGTRSIEQRGLHLDLDKYRQAHEKPNPNPQPLTPGQQDIVRKFREATSVVSTIPENCHRCGKPWVQHEFGVPAPYCP